MNHYGAEEPFTPSIPSVCKNHTTSLRENSANTRKENVNSSGIREPVRGSVRDSVRDPPVISLEIFYSYRMLAIRPSRYVNRRTLGSTAERNSI